MNYLLPYRFKKIGTISAILGLVVWVLMQKGFFTTIFSKVFGTNNIDTPSMYFSLPNTIIAIASFFSFLLGLFFVTFSKEKIEDEMVQRTRLDSFQIAALKQILFIVLGFVVMLVTKEPRKEGMVYFFVSAIFLFWFSFIGRFNYLLHFKYKY